MSTAVRNRFGLDRLPVEPFRQAFLDSGLSLSFVASELGWRKGGQHGNQWDTSRLRRVLGLSPHAQSRVPADTISYEKAVLIVRALMLDPVDFDGV